MITMSGILLQALFGQLLIGLINGSFYALLSLGLAVIFGMLHIINFAHGAFYMMGAFVAWFLLTKLGVGYWPALVIAPVAVGLLGVLIERTMLRRLHDLDHLYGLLLTFGLALFIQGLFENEFGSAGQLYEVPASLSGGIALGFMYLPLYRGWVVVVSLALCLATWFMIERTKLGSLLRASTENPSLVQAFGINVPRVITLTYGFGVGLAALAGVVAAPVYQVSPVMGSDLIIVVFAVVVIGGMGSIMGSVITGFALGVIEGLTKVFYPEASNTVIFVVMVIVLLIKPAGLFGKSAEMAMAKLDAGTKGWTPAETSRYGAFALIIAFFLIGPLFIYPVFLMKVMCFAMFAGAFNLLLGYVGLLSFGHAAFLGAAGYVCGHAAKAWGWPPELAIVAGVTIASALGVVIGALSIRRKGIDFAMITLALAQLVYFFCVQAPFTGGDDGMQSIPRGRLFGMIDLSDLTTIYLVVLAVFLAAFLLIYRIIHSPFGQVLKAIRENEPRALSLGYQVTYYKLVVFVLSAALSGVAGATKAIVFQIATLSDVHYGMSGEVVLMTLVGGMGTIFGPVVGALVMVAMQQYLATLGSWVLVVHGGIFVVCVLLFRRGIVGELGRVFGRAL